MVYPLELSGQRRWQKTCYTPAWHPPLSRKLSRDGKVTLTWTTLCEQHGTIHWSPRVCQPHTDLLDTHLSGTQSHTGPQNGISFGILGYGAFWIPVCWLLLTPVYWSLLILEYWSLWTQVYWSLWTPALIIMNAILLIIMNTCIDHCVQILIIMSTGILIIMNTIILIIMNTCIDHCEHILIIMSTGILIIMNTCILIIMNTGIDHCEYIYW